MTSVSVCKRAANERERSDQQRNKKKSLRTLMAAVSFEPGAKIDCFTETRYANRSHPARRGRHAKRHTLLAPQILLKYGEINS